MSTPASWSALYESGYAGSQLPSPLLALPVPRGARVLDVGCGTGRHLVRWGARATGIDFAPAALRGAPPGARLACGDAARLPFRPGSFDLVYSLGVVEHLPDTAQAVRESFAALAPGGWAYHSVPHARSVWTWGVRPLKRLLGVWRIGRERSFGAAAFRRIFEEAGFTEVSWRILPFAAYDCYDARWPLPLLYRAEDFLNARLPGVGFFLHMWGRKPTAETPRRRGDRPPR